MATFTSPYRAAAVGIAAAALLIGAFAIGASGSTGTGSTGTGSTGTGSTRSGGSHPAAYLASSGQPAKITVTGTGTVTGTPNQLVLSMGVQVNGPSVGSALRSANAATRRVTAALRSRGVAAADIQTSDLSIWPNYQNSSQIPVGYQVSESLSATLRRLGVAGTEIQAAVAAGGNATTVDGIALNLSDTSALLARARAAAVSDAKVKAGQYARALGQSLGPVLSVSDVSSTQPYPYPYANSPGDLTRAHSVPISPGSQQFSVSVTVVFALG